MKTAIINGMIFDAVSGTTRKNGAVILEDGKILAVLENVREADSYSVEETIRLGEEECLLPGLIDAHVHLAFGGVDKREKADSAPYRQMRFIQNGIINLMHGVTTLRDCGAADGLDINYKRALSRHITIGPHLHVCGQPLIASGGHCTYMGRQVDGPYEARKGTREQLDKMVDFIKIMVTGGISTPTGTPCTAQLKMDEIEAIIDIAHMNGKYVSVHLQGGDSLIPCVEAGVDTVEHGIFLTREGIDCMKRHGVYYIPTLSAIKMIADKGAEESVPLDHVSIEKAKAATAAHRESFLAAVEAGLVIGAGTDYKHGILANELETMVEYGWTAKDALLAATRNNAQILRIENRAGTIEAGKNADLLVVEGDPTQCVSHVRNVRMVFLDGERVVQDGMLAYPLTYLVEPIQSISNSGKG